MSLLHQHPEYLTQFPLLKLMITFISDLQTPQKKLTYYQYPAFLVTTTSMNGALNNPLSLPKLIQNSSSILIADPTTDQNKLCPDLTPHQWPSSKPYAMFFEIS